MDKFTHFDVDGKASMVDVSNKNVYLREAVAIGKIKMKPVVLKRIYSGEIEKGDVFALAKTAGILSAKKVGELIPLCHPINITHAEIIFNSDKKNGIIEIQAKIKAVGTTGVEMEALTAVSISALTIYDMCKALDKSMLISDIKLLKKEKHPINK